MFGLLKTSGGDFHATQSLDATTVLIILIFSVSFQGCLSCTCIHLSIITRPAQPCGRIRNTPFQIRLYGYAVA